MDSPNIGELRSPVHLATRTQAPSRTGTGLVDSFVNHATVRAKIVPVGTAVYLSGANTEYEITHRIWIRNDPTLDLFDFVFRDSILPDGTIRHEVYQVRRQAPVEGRHRFLLIEAMLLSTTIR